MYTNVVCKNVAYLETCAVCIRINLFWACPCLPCPSPSAQTTPPFSTRFPAVDISICPQPCPPNRCNCFHLLTCQSSQSICSFTPATLCQVVFDFLSSLQYLLLSSFPGIDWVCLCAVSALPNATLLFLTMRFFLSMTPTCSCSRSGFSPSSHLNHCSLVGPVDVFWAATCC